MLCLFIGGFADGRITDVDSSREVVTVADLPPMRDAGSFLQETLRPIKTERYVRKEIIEGRTRWCVYVRPELKDNFLSVLINGYRKPSL